MKHHFFAFAIIVMLFLLFTGLNANSQCIIKGKTVDDKESPLIGVNIYIKGSYIGTSSDVSGNFELTTDLTGKVTLVAQMISYQTIEKEIDLKKGEISISFILEEAAIGLEAIQIVAGSFEASDKHKSVVLQPLDIALTASSSADIYGALTTLPGVQLVGEEGKLFVRGGEAYETKTFIDGIQVEMPYSNTMQNMPTRSRFSPLLFSGTMFSTGGYSAEYGQALSSALILSTKGMPGKNLTNINLYSLGFGVSHTHKFENSAFIVSYDYGNLSPYYKVVKQNIDWIEAPESGFGTINYFHKTKNSGLFKTLFSYNHDNSELYYPYYGQNNTYIPLSLNNTSYLLNNIYKCEVGEKSYLKAGIGFSNDVNKILLDAIDLTDKMIVGQFKFTMSHELTKKFKILYGTDYFYKDFQETIDTNNADINLGYTSNEASLYTEAEIILTDAFVIRAGARAEYSSIIENSTIVPRLSFAYKFKKLGQVSVAYGTFYQNPESEYLKFTTNLIPERANHYIFNYQYSKNNRVVRMEAFYKKYHDLIKYTEINDPDPNSYNNNGYGFAQGVDLFYRDKVTIPKGDLWLSYSFLDTKRDYKDFPISASPKYFAKHNFTLVYKQWISVIKSHVGLTYYYSSGRPYYDPNKADNLFMSDKTIPYHDLSMNYAFDLSSCSKIPVTFFISVSNLLGSEHVFGYNYSTTTNTSGQYDLYPINPMAKRFYILAILFSLNK